MWSCGVFKTTNPHNDASKPAGSSASIVKSADSIGPCGIYQRHEDTVEDVQFCPSSAQEFCSVGDDSCLILWDACSGFNPVMKGGKAGTFIKYQRKEMDEFVGEGDKMLKDHEEKDKMLQDHEEKAAKKRRHHKEEVKLEKDFDAELTRLMQKYTPLTM